jgi:hypothetical protein
MRWGSGWLLTRGVTYTSVALQTAFDVGKVFLYCKAFTVIILTIVEAAILLCPEELASDDERLEVGLGGGGARTVCWACQLWGWPRFIRANEMAQNPRYLASPTTTKGCRLQANKVRRKISIGSSLFR